MRLGTFYDHILEAAKQTGMPIEAVLDELHSAGYKVMNVNLASVENAAALKETLAAHGMSVGDAFDYVDLISLPHDNESADRILAKAGVLGAERFLFLPPMYRGMSKPDIDSALCEGLAWASERAARHGLEPVIEAFDVGYTPLCFADIIQRALNTVPGLRLALDTGNYIHAGFDALHELKQSRGRLAGSVHLKDRTQKSQIGEPYSCLNGDTWYPCAAGEGEMHIAEVIAIIKQFGFNGVLYTEQYGSGEQLASLLRAAKFVNAEWFGEAE